MLKLLTDLSKKEILKLSRRKDLDEIRRVRSKLKTVDLKSIEITIQVYINDSLFLLWKVVVQM